MSRDYSGTGTNFSAVGSLIVAAAFLFVSAPAFCESKPTETHEERDLAELARLPRNVGHYLHDIVEVPRYMDRAQWRRFAVGAAAVGLLAVYDEDIRDRARKREDDFYDDFKVLGEARYAAGFFLASNLAGWAVGSEDLAETGAAGLEALVLTAVPTLLVQGVTGRERPRDGGSYRWFTGGHGASGHAAVAFATVTVLDRRYLTTREKMTRRQKLLRYTGKFLLYGAAACTALERIKDDKHFASDVAIGGSIGFLCANLVMNRRAPDMRLSLDGETAAVCFVREF